MITISDRAVTHQNNFGESEKVVGVKYFEMQSSFCPVKDIFGQRRHTSTVTGAYVFVFQLFTSLQFIFSNYDNVS